MFLKKFGVEHSTSTFNTVSSIINGYTESLVKIIKNLVEKTIEPGSSIDNDDFCLGLLEYRNTPRETGFSPSQILFGHNLTSCVPAHRKNLCSKWKEIFDEHDREKTMLNNKQM